MQLSNTQNKAVCKIIDKYDQDKKKILEFQAPTWFWKDIYDHKCYW